eukprot:4501745-Prymnesium_polylepis.1
MERRRLSPSPMSACRGCTALAARKRYRAWRCAATSCRSRRGSIARSTSCPSRCASIARALR